MMVLSHKHISSRMLPALLSFVVVCAATEKSLAFVCPAVNNSHTCTCSDISITCNNLGVANLSFIDPSALDIRLLSASNNEIREISAGFLPGAFNLKILKLRHNKITSIDVRSFESLITLKYLDLSYNQLSEFYLPRNTLRNLNSLNLMFNSLVQVRFDQNNKLDEVFLSHNQIKNNLEFVQNITKVRLLTLGSNLITNLSLSTFQKSSQLVVLRISDNSLGDLDFLNSTDMLSELDVANNSLKTISENAFINLKYLQNLSLAENGITEVNFITSVTSKIHLLDLSKNNISSIHFNYLESKTNLHYVDVSFNKLTDLNFITKIKKLRTLLADNNKISETDSTLFTRFSWGKSLKTLSLSNNLISNITFISHLRNVSVINLRNNSLVYIPPDTLSQLSNLTSLDLSFNKIRNVHFVRFSPFLRSINLSYNNIENLPCSDILYQLYLNGNNVTSFQLNCVSNLRSIAIYDGVLKDRKDQELRLSREVLLNISDRTVTFPCFPSIDMILKCKYEVCNHTDAKGVKCNVSYDNVSVMSPFIIILLIIIIPLILLTIFCIIMKCCVWYRRKLMKRKKCSCSEYLHTNEQFTATELDLETS